MQGVVHQHMRKRLFGCVFTALLDYHSPCLIHTHTHPSSTSTWLHHSTISHTSNTLLCPPKSNLLASPWSAFFCRRFKIDGSTIRAGNVIEKKDRIYQVLKVEHSHEGRGKATIKLQLRDIDSGNKVTQRLGTEEAVENRDGKVLLMDPDTLDQLEVAENFFGKNVKYLQDEMKVKVELYNGIPLSASIPKHVTYTVKEAQPPMKGIAATPKDKMAVLDNGLTVKVPPHILVGEAIIIDTEDGSYVRRVK